MKNSYMTSYVFQTPYYFLSGSQIIDYQLGRFHTHNNSKKQKNYGQFNTAKFYWALQQLQKASPAIQAILIIFYSLFESESTLDPRYLQISQKAVKYALEKQTLLISINALKNLMKRCQTQKDSSPIFQQMAIKGLFNIVYLLIYQSWKQIQVGIRMTKDGGKIPEKSKQLLIDLKQLFMNTDMDSLLMKAIGLSLQVHYMPMKKLTMLYTLVLTTIFFQQPSTSFGFQETSFHLSRLSFKQQKKVLERQLIYRDDQLRKLAYENQLTQNYLTENAKKLAQKRKGPVQKYYKKHNTGECPLAQFVVVGMLRSLLTICNGHTHKKVNIEVQKGTGVDAYRQWQISYLYCIQNYQSVSKQLSESSLKKIAAYRQFNQTSGKVMQSEDISQTQLGQLYQKLFDQFYSHKIYSTTAVSSFFVFLLISFKRNLFIQYSYFLQLITDANGILVFLKFLTDKFQFIGKQSKKPKKPVKQSNRQVLEFLKNQNLKFSDQVMLTIYIVLAMLFTSCNNYPQKIKNYLFEYNSYLIIKKIPRLFIPEKQKTEQIKKQNSAQNQAVKPNKQSEQHQLFLPSRQDVENSHFGILPQLTELCYDLLKIQIPFFSKKANKQNSNTMRMVIDIYCRYPKKVQPIKRTEFQKMLLKNKVINKEPKYISSVEQLKNFHNDFNNQHYWGNDFLDNDQYEDQDLQGSNRKRLKQNIKILGKIQSQQRFKGNPSGLQIDYHVDVDKWLQENVWRYYD